MGGSGAGPVARSGFGPAAPERGGGGAQSVRAQPELVVGRLAAPLFHGGLRAPLAAEGDRQGIEHPAAPARHPARREPGQANALPALAR